MLVWHDFSCRKTYGPARGVGTVPLEAIVTDVCSGVWTDGGRTQEQTNVKKSELVRKRMRDDKLSSLLYKVVGGAAVSVVQGRGEAVLKSCWKPAQGTIRPQTQRHCIIRATDSGSKIGEAHRRNIHRGTGRCAMLYIAMRPAGDRE